MQRRARKRAGSQSNIGVLERWFSDKYNLPPNDPLFRRRTLGSLVQEFLDDLVDRREELLDQMRENKPTAKMQDALEAIDRVLGIEAEQDDWLEEVEKALEEGRIPEGF